MNFNETNLLGVFTIDLERRSDERGFFARTWCQKEFLDHGLNSNLIQCSISLNSKKGTLRGMHYQTAPFAEAKVVRCTAGSIYDVILDLRRQSPTFKQWFGAELSATNRRSLYVAEGCAHGFVTMADDTEVLYQMSEFYHPESSHGVRWNDPAFQIDWPQDVAIISERDRTYVDFEPK